MSDPPFLGVVWGLYYYVKDTQAPWMGHVRPSWKS